jgi:uncharacterized protein YlxW (UPF0749 family)
VSARSVAAAQDPELLAELEALRAEVRQLKARVGALERLVGNAGEHPTDKAVVREKAVYDWQG